MTRAVASRTVARFERACSRAGTAERLMEFADLELRRGVDYDAAIWLGVDPATLLAGAPCRIAGQIDGGYCEPLWRTEFYDDDPLHFSHLARNPEPAATLRAVTGDAPARSSRYREFIAPQGYSDELRAVFRVAGQTWGVLALYRRDGRLPFEPEDVDQVSAVSATMANALRTRLATELTPWPPVSEQPGVLFFDSENILVSANEGAADWLRDAYGPEPVGSWIDVFGDRTADDLRMPLSTIPLLVRARAVAAGREPGPARLRLRDRNGRWLLLHASVMATPPLGDDGVAVVIEPAKSADIAPIVIEAYGLSPRERDVVQAVAQGLSTQEIATTLFLSTHTVRDYLKGVFDKVGVSSRGELVARLFADHYSPRMHESLVFAG